VVFALNILAFIFIGLQIRPVLANLDAGERDQYLEVAVSVLVTVILARAAWHMPFNAIVRWRHRMFGFNPPRPMLRPSIRSGILISWAGMRGIVTLAAAMALPAAFPYRDLVLLTAFFVVLGTLLIQGLTLKPLLRWLKLQDDDPVGRETQAAQERALSAGLAIITGDQSPGANAVRHHLKAVLAPDANPGATRVAQQVAAVHRQVVDAARQAVVDMRTNDEIGDDAFHVVEEQLDRFEASLESE
jgi:CPA1 family monovalent cation:H+ antiporter